VAGHQRFDGPPPQYGAPEVAIVDGKELAALAVDEMRTPMLWQH